MLPIKNLRQKQVGPNTAWRDDHISVIALKSKVSEHMLRREKRDLYAALALLLIFITSIAYLVLTK